MRAPSLFERVRPWRSTATAPQPPDRPSAPAVAPVARSAAIPARMPRNAWHQLKGEEVLRLLDVDPRTGLSAAEVLRRQQKFGANRITLRRGTPVWLRALRQFNQPLVYLLLLAVLVTGSIGQWVDSSVILGVVLVNAVIGFLQEAKAEGAISALAQRIVTETTVRRDGRPLRLNAQRLVPGDVVLLEPGDRVSADLRLFTVRGLQLDESALTGESAAVHKNADPLALETIIADRTNTAFAGTLVTAGRGEGVVSAIADQTELGRIATLVTEAVEISTPLTRKLAQLSRSLLWLILLIAVATFFVGWWQGRPTVEMFMAAIALAVGAIPEGLPAAVTIALAIGVARMARRRAIVRNLPAVETLGSTTVICSDKTGTLTENQMTVQEIYAGGRIYHVSGTGYHDTGRISHADKIANLTTDLALAECLQAGLLCNDARFVPENGQVVLQGDATEAALLVAARKGGIIGDVLTQHHPRIDAIPFESEHQFMATLHEIHGHEHRVIYKKGAVERLLERCTNTLDDHGKIVALNKDDVRAAADRMAAQGLRVLAFARRVAAHDHRRLEHEHVSSGLTFLGLQAMLDPPRPAAITAVHRCLDAGIAVKMITGDHALTATAIATKLGLRGERETSGALGSITGHALAQIPEQHWPEIAEKTTIFARVMPAQKLGLVRALQARGHIVTMTGDGVNDAPALKQADVGVAMGLSGTDVARDAADVILTDDNFASIEAAVEEGRGVFDNLNKFIVCTLPTNSGEAVILLGAIVAGMTLPALPVQFLWVNMTTAILVDLVLVFEPKERGIMQRPPRDPHRSLLTFALAMRTCLVTLLMAAGAFWLFASEAQRGGVTIAAARTATINVIVCAEIAYLFNCRSLTRPCASIGWFSNRWAVAGTAAILGLQLLFTYAPVMNHLFHTAPISVEAWARILAVAVAVFAAVEFEKWIRFGRARKGRVVAE